MSLKRIRLGLLVAAPLAFGFAAPAKAYDIIQVSQNKTGVVANGQRLTLFGAQAVSPESLALGPTKPFTTLGLTVAPTATGISYTNQPVDPNTQATISVRTAGSSALTKSLTWLSSTGTLVGNATVVGGSCTASPNATTAVPPSGSRGGSGIKLAQNAAPTKSLDWTFYNSSPHAAYFRIASFQFLRHTIIPGDTPNLPPTETFTPADILAQATAVRLFGGAQVVRTQPGNAGNFTFQFLLPPGGGVVYHFFPINVNGDIWVQAIGVVAGNDPGKELDLNAFLHRTPFPTCVDGPRAWNGGLAKAAFARYRAAQNTRASRRSDLDNLIIAEGDVLLATAGFQVTNLNTLVPGLDLPGLADLLDPSSQNNGHLSHDKGGKGDDHGGKGGKGKDCDPVATQAEVELGALLLNLTRNAICPDDNVTIGDQTLTVEQWMYKAANLIDNDPRHHRDNATAFLILRIVNRSHDDD